MYTMGDEKYSIGGEEFTFRELAEWMRREIEKHRMARERREQVEQERRDKESEREQLDLFG